MDVLASGNINEEDPLASDCFIDGLWLLRLRKDIENSNFASSSPNARRKKIWATDKRSTPVRRPLSSTVKKAVTKAG